MLKPVENFSLDKLNTFGIKANADLFFEFEQLDELKLFQKQYKSQIISKPVFIIGGGSNVVFIGDFKGLIIRNNISETVVVKETRENVFVKSSAGVIWDSFVDFTVRNNWGGLEHLSLIPGRLGACPVQNIGAYGKEVKDYITEVNIFDLKEQKQLTLSNKQCKFSYRNSIFKQKFLNRFMVLDVTFRLNKNPIAEILYKDLQNEIAGLKKADLTIRDIRNAVISVRNRKLPDYKQQGNAGSYFKNPEIEADEFRVINSKYPKMPFYELPQYRYKIPAAWLIEQCGWKGKRMKSVGVSEKHALILINYDGATGADVVEMATKIKKDVYKKFKINLEEEVTYV